MKGHLYPFTKSGRWRQLPSRIAGSTAGGAGTSGPRFIFTSTVELQSLLSRRSGSTAGRAGTSGIPVVPAVLPVLLPVNNRSAPELAPEVDTGRNRGVFKPAGAEVPLNGPVLPVYRKFRLHFRCYFRRKTGAYQYWFRGAPELAPEVGAGSNRR